ncbi:polysaccharide biosynthesis C-terminal domain-containing protein [Dehalococcoides sp. THU3]|uniref:lipopolysaccharide biosynthesis protein n=1 Tax=Dehalococcoides TaxID=61434 RepID=UPI0005B57204|nr:MULTISPECIES: polysaccharide biosynthesis C-terminal domain-containing protein [Dehalococcoides]QYY58494.1 polysaccharide biosynthesis C-terminal domain-containing protein [Dehalococcoides mccartyi]BAQ34203.1 putative membrane protein [Dehalococcoides sp. UCH007]
MAYIFNKTHPDTSAGMQTGVLKPYRFLEKIRSPLYINAIFLMIAGGTGAVLSFVFWILAAHFFTPESVGLAGAVISAMSLLGTISHLGLGFGIIRFLPQNIYPPKSIINSSISLTFVVSVLAGCIFLLGLGIWSPELIFLRQSPLLAVSFLAFTAATALNSIADDSLIAHRHSGYSTLRVVTASGLRLILVVILAGISPENGITSAWGIALIAALFMAVFGFIPKVLKGFRPGFELCSPYLRSSFGFSLGNNLSQFLGSAPALLLPLLVLGILGAESNAYFYIGWSTAAALTTIPASISTSLFSEGSHDEKGLALHIHKSLKLSLGLIIPLVIILFLLADKILLFFGQEYALSSAGLLRIMIIGLIPQSLNVIYMGILKVKKHLKQLILLNCLIAGLSLILSFGLIPVMGINGAGLAWVIAQSFCAVYVSLSLFSGRSIPRE